MWVPDIGELLFSCSRPSYSPPNQRCRWFVVYGGYAAFDTSPPAIIVVAKADFPIVAHHPRALVEEKLLSLVLEPHATVIAGVLKHSPHRGKPRVEAALSDVPRALVPVRKFGG